MPDLKKLFNKTERVVNEKLVAVCKPDGLSVYAKVRLADVLPIENSGIGHDEYKFALQSHFDFVVYDKFDLPQFTVEFDGPTHTSFEQAQRDAIKNRLCERFGLPLLRINSKYLTPSYRGYDLLTYIVEVWSLSNAFDKAQEEGHIPWEEGFDPNLIMSPDMKGFPLWLSQEISVTFQRDQKKGLCHDYVPTYLSGTDTEGIHRGLAFIRINLQVGVIAKTAMQNQQFPTIWYSDLLHHLVLFDLRAAYENVLAGKLTPVELSSIGDELLAFRKRVKFGSWGGPMDGAGFAPGVYEEVFKQR